MTTPPCLRRGFTTFGSFNNAAKITPEVVALWARVLLASPGSRLVLNRWQFENEGVRNRYRWLFEGEGVDASRIEFRASRGLEEYFGGYQEVDIILDTVPFGGGTTTLECLWMGVPVVGLSTDRFPGRMTESILNAVGANELLSTGEDDFVKVATELAADHIRLTNLRTTLRDQVETSPLCDIPGFARKLEKSFTWMWDNRPVSQAVSPV